MISSGRLPSEATASVKVLGTFAGDPAVSAEIQYDVEISGSAPEKSLQEFVDHVDRIAEIPNSLRQGTSVTLRKIIPG